MPDKSTKSSPSKSGMYPRPSFAEPEARREPPPPPPNPPEYFDGGATTGAMPVITEGEDSSAERDNDKATGGV